MSSNYEGKYSRKAEKKPHKKFNLKRTWRRFRRSVRQNRFYQIGIALLICLIFFGLGCLHQSIVDKNNYAVTLQGEINEVRAGYEATIRQMDEAHKEEIQALRAEYENFTPEELLKQEGEFLARMLYAYRNNSERDLRTAIWCALNRVDSVGYPNSVKEVCQQPSQWMGYSDDNPILNNLYEIAIKELETWHSGYRPVGTEYVYMNWSTKQITLRDTWEKGNDTSYWQAG